MNLALCQSLFAPGTGTSAEEYTGDAKTLLRIPLALLEGEGSINEMIEAWAIGQAGSLDVRLRCTSLPQVAAAVEHLGLGAVLPDWAASTFRPGSVVQCRLPALKSLTAPLLSTKATGSSG